MVQKESNPNCLEYTVVLVMAIVAVFVAVVLLVGQKLNLVTPEQIEKLKNIKTPPAEDSAADAR